MEGQSNHEETPTPVRWCESCGKRLDEGEIYSCEICDKAQEELDRE